MDMHRIKEVETRIEYPLQRATVVGKIDVILHDEGGIEIWDYKSSDLVTSQEEVTMQLQLYANGLTRLGETVTRGSVAYLEDATITHVEIAEGTIREAERIAEQRIDGIMRGRFQPCPGNACGHCDYGMICRYCGG